MEKIAIDMDEVIADFMTKFLRLFNDTYCQNVCLSDLHGKSLRDLHPEAADEMQKFIREPCFFRNLPVMKDSPEVIKELSEHYDIFITSAAMEYPTSFTAKYEWLKENFGFLSEMNFVFCGDKSIIYADYLIDDNIRHFKRFSGQGILFTAPHNVNESGYIRVNSWLEVKKHFLG